MSEPQFPQNHPYIQATTNRQIRVAPSSAGRTQINNSQVLLQRVQDLEKQLTSLTTLLMEDGGFEQAYVQIQQQNQQLKSKIGQYEGFQEQAKQLEIQNQLLKQNLLKQNEEMEDLYQRLQQSQNSKSRLQDRGHSQQLENKIQELNDEISKLLVKIQDLVEENNQRINYEQEISGQLQNLIRSYNETDKKLKELQVENDMLKEQIHNMEELSIGQQNNLQDKYLQEIEEANKRLEDQQRLREEAHRLREESCKELEETHRELEEAYRQLQEAHKQIDELKITQKQSLRAGQIRDNTDRAEDRTRLQQEVNSLRSELVTRNEELVWQSENEINLRRKWQQKMILSENEIVSLNEQNSKLRARLRQQQSKCSEYEFVLEQQQKDRQRLAFYKNSYADTQQLRTKIVHLEASRQEMALKAQKLQVELSQRQFEPHPIVQIRQSHDFNHLQTEEQLQKCKKLNKQLKISIGKYEKDYRDLRVDFEKLLLEKVEAERSINFNKGQLQRHKSIYEQLVVRYNQTSSLYKQLQQKLIQFEGQRNGKSFQNQRSLRPVSNQTNYDKENIHLIKLENSTLKQQISNLKDELSSKANRNITSQNAQVQHRRQFMDLKKRERQCVQQLQMYRQKYLRQLQKSKGDKQILGKMDDLEEKLLRVNRMLNQKMKEIEYFQNRQKELLSELDQVYIKCKHQFDTYGVRHHPQVKSLQSDLLSAQRQIMESELAFKQQITQCQDELRSCRLQNQHHRAKIDQLLLEVNRERNSIDYAKINRSLELSELTRKELEREVEHKENLINELRDQLKKNQSKERHRLQSSGYNKEVEQLKQEKENIQFRMRDQDSRLSNLTECLNAIDPSSRSEDTLRRAISILSKMVTNTAKQTMANDKYLRQEKTLEHSRYEQLARKKSQIIEQFKHSQQFLLEQKESIREDKHGILQRLRQNLAT